PTCDPGCPESCQGRGAAEQRDPLSLCGPALEPRDVEALSIRGRSRQRVRDRDLSRPREPLLLPWGRAGRRERPASGRWQGDAIDHAAHACGPGAPGRETGPPQSLLTGRRFHPPALGVIRSSLLLILVRLCPQDDPP